jgi:hypothetical protein
MDFGGPVMPGREKKPVYTVTVAKPDGSEAKDVYTENEYVYGSIDWAPVVPQPAAKPENEKEKEPATAWGEEVGGLQAGLRYPKRVLGRGESVEVELLLRNVGKSPLAFEYLAWEDQPAGSVTLSGTPERGELRLEWSVSVTGKPRKNSAYLRPGDEMVRGRVALSYWKPTAPGARPSIELEPGVYRVRVMSAGVDTDRFEPGGGPPPPPGSAQPQHDQGEGEGQPAPLGWTEFPALGTGVLELILPGGGRIGPALIAPGGGEVARPRQPGGVLGDRLGEYLTIEGVLAEGVKLETGTFLVERVNGKKLDKPVTILVRVHGFDATRFDLPVGYVMKSDPHRTILKGFESGEMIGVPEGVRAAAKEMGRAEVPVSSKEWQWRPYFVALIISEPKAEPKQ